MRTRTLGFFSLALIASIAPVNLLAEVRADVIADWNAIAATAVTASGRSDSYERSHVLAVVNLAMFEATNLGEGKHASPFAPASFAPIGASHEAAAAAAAHYVLSQLYPEQRVSFTLALVRSLEAIPDGEEKFIGQILGTSAGKRVYARLASPRKQRD